MPQIRDYHHLKSYKIERWSTKNGFKFSKSKTLCTHFCHLRKAYNDPVLTLDGTPIPVAEDINFKVLSLTENSFCWLVGCFGFNGPLRQYFSLYRAVSQREGEREEKG